MLVVAAGGVAVGGGGGGGVAVAAVVVDGVIVLWCARRECVVFERRVSCCGCRCGQYCVFCLVGRCCVVPAEVGVGVRATVVMGAKGMQHVGDKG